MCCIQTADTTPELRLRRLLWRDGYRFRLSDRSLPGKPDIVLPRWKAVIFVNGCFWHAHEQCRYFKLPGTRVEFWSSKLQANAARGKRATEECRALGWRTITIWECALRKNPTAAAFLAGSAIRGKWPSANVVIRMAVDGHGLLIEAAGGVHRRAGNRVKRSR
ncbi:MAG: DNA mismatch endonuclease Vsr [Xanthomonadales bacterium]|nr:DNA mismatch endonuclease Vsr [Xanthomonadales bacterium]